MGERKSGEKEKNMQKFLGVFLWIFFFLYREKHPVLPQPHSEQQCVPPLCKTELGIKGEPPSSGGLDFSLHP